MNKRFWIGFVLVFVTLQILDGIVNFIILDPMYRSIPNVMRPQGEVKLWLLPITGLFFSFFFTYIFARGYEGKGIMEGARYGLYIGLMFALPTAYGAYATMQIPYWLALQRFIYGTLEYMVAGTVLDIVLKPKEQDPPAM